MKDKILELRSQGKTYNEIVEILGCSKGTISYHCGKRTGVKKQKIKKTCIACGNKLKKNAQKYCSHACQNNFQFEKRLKDDDLSPRMVKRHLQSVDNSCSICGQSDSWNEKPLVLVLDHIDGNPENNSLSNFRLVCPNCDSQLPTFKSRNKGNGRHSRRERYSDGKSY